MSLFTYTRICMCIYFIYQHMHILNKCWDFTGVFVCRNIFPPFAKRVYNKASWYICIFFLEFWHFYLLAQYVYKKCCLCMFVCEREKEKVGVWERHICSISLIHILTKNKNANISHTKKKCKYLSRILIFLERFVYIKACWCMFVRLWEKERECVRQRDISFLFFSRMCLQLDFKILLICLCI